jgi:DNA polymerase-3 subunit delta
LQAEQPESFAPVYLIHGEEILYKTALNTLLDAMIPPAKRSHHYDPLEGTHNNIQEAIERVNTYSLLSGTKVVALCDSNVFYSRQDEGKLIEKAKEAYDNQDNKNAARSLLNLMGLLKLSFDDLRIENRSRFLKLDLASLSDDSWLDKVINYCLEKALSVPIYEDSATVLQQAVERGFPKGNHLIITADWVDKRRLLYKTIGQKGVIIDCSVPKGSRRADRMAQQAALSERKDALLNRFGKTIEKNAYQTMCEMTGFDLRIFSHNLEKLISYVGERREITIDDVQSVLKRTKKDPIYEFTNAVSDRNIQGSIFLLNSLLDDNLHPLQILAALTNQIRKLLLVKGFVDSAYGRKWHAAVRYNYFKSNIMPALQDYDRDFLNQLEKWNSVLLSDDNQDDHKQKKKGKKSSGQAAVDLIVVKNPNNPYPVYQLLLKSEMFTTEELISAMDFLSKTDLRLKSTGQNPKFLLEEAIFFICGQKRMNS